MSDQDASDATTVDDGSATDEDGTGESDAAESRDDRRFPFEDVDADFDETAFDDPDVDVEEVDLEAILGDDVREQLVERVEEADPEPVAHELAALRARVEALEDQLDAREEELDDLTSKLKRKQADFQNYKKRMEKRREQEKQRATEDLVERLLDVRDNLTRALGQDDPSVDDLREGVESTLRQFDRVLEAENVTVIEPTAGEDVDPQRHEVLMRVESAEPADTIADVHRPGYVMAEKVLRPAQVTVSDGSAGADSGAGDGTDGESNGQ